MFHVSREIETIVSGTFFKIKVSSLKLISWWPCVDGYSLWHFSYLFCSCFQALSVLGAQREKDLAAKREREVELSKVSIKKDDVELIVSRFGCFLNW